MLVLAASVALLVAIRVLAGSAGAPAGSPTPPPLSAYLYPEPLTAPLPALVDQDGTALQAGDLSGGPTLVFFGYTHCPDVCPATIGIVGDVVAQYGTALRALFITVDPERDTVSWLRDYVRYLPAGFRALTGSPAQVRATADAWGVRYARVDAGTPGEYSMSHTAEVYLVDGTGRLRAHFPFGTEAHTILEVVRMVAGSGGPLPASPAGGSPVPGQSASGAPGASPPGPASGLLSVEVVSTSIWAGGGSPVILRLFGPHGRLNDPAAGVTVELRAPGAAGSTNGTVRAVAVQPPMVADVSYVATLDIPAPGSWTIMVRATSGESRLSGTASLAVLHPGRTAALGRAAPAVRTPTLADVDGLAMAITTDPLPDRRLYALSTVDALAARRPFVMVVDSARFKVTDACGTALAMVKYLPDRWEPVVTFVHLEPFVYDIVTDSPVLRGDLASPPLNAAAAAWGFEGDPWGPTAMPWVFVVDGDGIVRAKYQGVIGSDDIDVILSLVTAGG